MKKENAKNEEFIKEEPIDLISFYQEQIQSKDKTIEELEKKIEEQMYEISFRDGYIKGYEEGIKNTISSTIDKIASIFREDSERRHNEWKEKLRTDSEIDDDLF